ncbi:hypothetical protein [Bordetella sp. BOR01]|uniref:hypothetical protein n=1 Tax=Bordetella sp. BOR01 TaxID=2854779 RepID=UPI001C450DED|nr:hypothetical protein [Bordetella sp. BOR01]MBV7485902.1 hypothetical protein [Bordetella sp. BOR01]
MNMRRMQKLYCALILGAAGVTGATVAQAAGTTTSGSVQSQYELDVQRCNTGQTNQDRATCLQEAGAAREEAARKRLDNGQSANYGTNATARCNNLPQTQRQDCMRQMSAPSSVKGSVEGGGVLRETVIPVPAQSPGAAPGTMTQPPGAAPGTTVPPAVPGTAAPAPVPGAVPGTPMPGTPATPVPVR